MIFIDNADHHTPYENFRQASSALLEVLAQTFEMGLWVVARTNGDSWTVLAKHGDAYPLVLGDSLRWSDSVCSRMVKPGAPHVVPDLSAVPDFASAPFAKRFGVGSYIGLPIVLGNGEIFGTLCAIDPGVRDESFRQVERCCSTAARMLSTIIAYESQRLDYQRAADRMLVAPELDAATGLYNRRAYQQCAAFENDYARGFGSSVGIVVVDLKPEIAFQRKSGVDRMTGALRHLGLEILQGLRPLDLAARPSKDQIVVLMPNSDSSYTKWFAEHVKRVCQANVPEARVQWIMRNGRQKIHDAVDQALDQLRTAA